MTDDSGMDAVAALTGDRRNRQRLCNLPAGRVAGRRHDLRRTGGALLGELPDIMEAALNHVAIRSSVAATYNRSRYRPEVAALQRLAWTQYRPGAPRSSRCAGHRPA